MQISVPETRLCSILHVVSLIKDYLTNNPFRIQHQCVYWQKHQCQSMALFWHFFSFKYWLVKTYITDPTSLLYQVGIVW